MQRSRMIGCIVAVLAVVPLGASGLAALATTEDAPAPPPAPVPASARPAMAPPDGPRGPVPKIATAVPEALREETSIKLGGPAALLAEGAAITLPITMSCPQPATVPSPAPYPNPETSFGIQVTQAIGGGTTGGWGNGTVACDGAEHLVKVDIVVSAPTPAFRPGVAFARADLYVCSPEFCGQLGDTGEITISGKAG